MSNNNGKFFDVGDTSLFFTDIEDATTYFELCANYFFEDVETFENTEAWQGEDAEVAKKVLGGTEKQLLLDIIQLHKDMKEVNAAIIDNFGLMVDKAADGHIEYDVVEKIRNDFQDMRSQFEDEVKLVVNKHSELSRFEKYGTFSDMNFTEQMDRFVRFCGAGSNNYSGYLGECLHKLIFFDSDAKSYIKDMDFESRIEDINSRMCQFVISHCPESQAAQYIDDIDKFEEVYLAEKAEATINSDVCTWRVMDIVIMVDWYNKALEEGDTETLEKFYNALNESKLVSTNNKGIPTKLDGKNYDQYIAYMQPEKTYLLMIFDAGMGYGETEGFQQLYTLSQSNVICEVPTGTEAPKFGVKVGEIPQGLVVNWGATYKEEGILNNYQGVIFNQDGLSYDQKYDLIEEEEKVEDYRDNLKIVKDATRVAELEKKCIFADENSSAAQYHEGLDAENDDSNRYRFINDINYQLGALCSNAAGGCSEYLDDALGFMTEEQIRNYNYLYYQDSINGTDYADEYIDLLIPSLRQKAAAAQYEGIKDSTALKAVYEVGIGLDSISTGIENVFGLNDDRDGVAVQSTYEYLDGMIMSSAKTKGEMYLYSGSKAVGAAIPAVGITVATGGAGAVGLVAGAVGTGALYGVSAGGNSKAQAEREGYTESQAVAYGIATGVEQGVKTSAMFAVGGAGRFATGIPVPVGVLGAGVTGFTMEYVDEVYINPAIRANILNDEAAYNIDYKQALINAGITGAFTAGAYYMFSKTSPQNTSELVANENVEIDAIDSPEVVVEDVAGVDGESVINTDWYKPDGSINYPPNNGAVPGTEVNITLKQGESLGRYGAIGPRSNFVTETGADANKLALPPTTDPNVCQEFEVIKEIPDTTQAVIAKWGGSDGGGLQYELPKPILQLIREGYLVPK